MSEFSYLNLLQELVDKAEHAEPTIDRTGVGTWNLFHRTFPLIAEWIDGKEIYLGTLDDLKNKLK